MSDRVVILNHGELQQAGTPREVFTEPANTFVAEFIGSPSMNFFDVELDGSTLVGDELSYTLSDAHADRIREQNTSDALRLGIRPEHMVFADDGDSNAIDAVLQVREPIGDDNYLYLQTGDTEFTMRVLGQVDYAEGDEIPVSFEESDAHFFDRSTGENVLLRPEVASTAASDTAPQEA